MCLWKRYILPPYKYRWTIEIHRCIVAILRGKQSKSPQLLVIGKTRIGYPFYARERQSSESFGSSFCTEGLPLMIFLFKIGLKQVDNCSFVKKLQKPSLISSGLVVIQSLFGKTPFGGYIAKFWRTEKLSSFLAPLLGHYWWNTRSADSLFTPYHEISHPHLQV